MVLSEPFCMQRGLVEVIGGDLEVHWKTCRTAATRADWCRSCSLFHQRRKLNDSWTVAFCRSRRQKNGEVWMAMEVDVLCFADDTSMINWQSAWGESEDS